MGRGGRAAKKDIRKKTRPRSLWQRLLFRFGWLIPLSALIVGSGVLLATYTFASIPLPADVRLTSSAEIYDRNGKLLGVYSDEIRRFILNREKLDALPDHVAEAIIAAEDKDFYRHNGVSVRGIVRAGWANVTGGEIQQGGSTITQQYVKNAVLQNPERTITRKVKEAILAIKLERRHSKREILGFYLNTIYLGRGAYGIEAAARTYFGVNARDLTLPQAAYLAAIVPSPELYQPDENPERARARRDAVLRRMVEQGFIKPRQAERAMRKKVKLDKAALRRNPPQQGAYFVEWLRREVSRDPALVELSEERGVDPVTCLYTCGLKIHTTLDMDLQKAAEESIEAHLTEDTDPEAAVVSMTPTGQVLAMVGGRGQYANLKVARGFNYATDYPGRQAGSAYKPFTLLEAIEQGISPNSRFSGSSPRRIDDERCQENGEDWEVENYGGSSFGTITLDQATTNSVNTVYAQLGVEVGPDRIAELLEEFDFDRKGRVKRDIEGVCALPLGTLPVTPMEMARAYAGFTARGALPKPIGIRYIEDSDGNCLTTYVRLRKLDCDAQVEADPARVVARNSADVLNQVLTHVTQGGTATAASLPGWEVAGKTGTTQENRDAWFAGSVPRLTTVVWMGYQLEPPNKKAGLPEAFVPRMGYCSNPVECRPVHGIEVTGGSFPARIWHDFMIQAVERWDPVPWPEPQDIPDKVINSPAPPPPAPAPAPSKTPKPKKTEEPEPLPPSPSPSPEPLPSPEPTPTPEPFPDSEGGGGARASPKDGDP